MRTSIAVVVLVLVGIAAVQATTKPGEGEACNNGQGRCLLRRNCPGGKSAGKWWSGHCKGIYYCCHPEKKIQQSAAPRTSKRPVARPTNPAASANLPDLPDAPKDFAGSVKAPLMITLNQKAIDVVENELLPHAIQGKRVVGKNLIEKKGIEPIPIKIWFWKRIIKIPIIQIDKISHDPVSTRIVFNPQNSGIDIYLSKVSIQAFAEVDLYKNDGKKFDRKHTVTIILKEATIHVSAKLGNKNGMIASAITKGDLVIPKGNLDVQLRTQVGDKKRKRRFLNWLVNLFENMLARVASKQFAKNLAGINKALDKALSKVPRNHEIKPIAALNMKEGIKVDTSLHGKPVITKDAMTFTFNGKVYTSNKVCRACPLRPKAPNTGSHMLEVDLGEHIPCCAIQALHGLGALNFRGIVPAPKIKAGKDRVKKSIGSLVDAIFTKFSVSWEAVALKAPVLRFTKNGVFVQAEYKASAYLVKGNSFEDKVRELVSFTITVRETAAVKLEKDNVIVPVMKTVPQVKLGSIALFGEGEIDSSIVTEINKFGKSIINDVVVPKLNEKINEWGGFQLFGTKEFSPVNSQIEWNDGYVTVRSDMRFHFTEELIAKFLLAA